MAGLGEGTGLGKAILFGEHAVVYGYPALAAALPRAVRATALLSEGPSSLSIPVWDNVTTVGDNTPLARALETVRPEGVAVTAEVELPAGAGLGCSAALGVAVVRAVSTLLGEREDASRFDAWERVFHGSPSGLDAAMASRGGVALFSKKAGADPIASQATTLVIAHTGVASSTLEMVERVAKLKTREPDRVRKVFEGIETIVHNGARVLSEPNPGHLGQLMDMNHTLLSSLLISSSEIEDVRAAARDRGALGSKLTGAGGGGCVLVVPSQPEEAEALAESLSDVSSEAFVVTIGGENS